MVEAKLTAVLASVLVITGCSGRPEMTWEKVAIDGSRTGVTAVSGDNVSEALGTFRDGLYTAPNGRTFDCGSVPSVAKAIIDAQPDLAHMKRIIGHSPAEMYKKRPQSPLSNWSVDALMKGVETTLGKKVDVGLLNFGGIRKNLPEGDVLIEDIVDIFPFRNYLTWVQLKGSDLRYIYEDLVSRNNIQVFGGVKMVVEGQEIKSIEIGGKPLDDNALYGLATVDFLLDGGDNVYAARNARQLVISDVKVNEWLVGYVRSLTAEGKDVQAEIDDRIEVLK